MAEHSYSQQKFHVDRLSVSIDKNRRSLCNNTQTDWVIVGIFETEDEAHEFCRIIKKKLNL